MIESVTKDVISICQPVQRVWDQSQKQCTIPLSVFRPERLKVIGVWLPMMPSRGLDLGYAQHRIHKRMGGNSL
jgi:hypothetical protein